MTKIFEWLENNSIKIIITVVITWGLFFGILYVQGIKSNIYDIQKEINIKFLEFEETNSQQHLLQVKGLLLIIEQLEELAKQQAYVIDQNREKTVVDRQVVKKLEKPSYELLKSRTVYIVGCSDKVLDEKDRIQFGLGGEGACWSGTASIIKITDTETYLLSNNHVFGKDEKNIHIYVENGKEKVEATIVAYHKYEDIAVAKIPGKLEGKTAMTKISSVKIQDPVYVVGNPLGVKYVYSEGILAGYEDTSLLFQMPCIYGNSGSAIWDKYGNLVGVVFALEMYHGWMGIPEARITHTLSIDSLVIKNFLTDLGLYND